MTMRGKRARALAAGLALLLMLGAVALLPDEEWPFAFAAGFAIAAISLLFVGYAIVPNAAAQNLLLSLASVSFGFAVAEIGAWYLNISEMWDTNTLEYNMDDPDLGYSLAPNQHGSGYEADGDHVIFKVNYTINAFGFRATPGPATAPCRALFLGDSLTFGWGLPDDETLPARFTLAAGGRYRADNASLNGYGPHQMLRLLETGRAAQALGAQPIDLVIYQGIKAHVSRAAGRTTWDLRGPRYVLSGGGVRYAGSFHGDAYVFLWQSVLYRSQVVTYLKARSEDDEDLVRRYDLPLFVAIIKQMQREVERRFGGASFVVLFSDSGDKPGIAVRRRLAEAGVPVISFQQIIPDIYTNERAYQLSPLDQHPNLAFNDLVARYLVEKMGPERCRPAAAAAEGGGPATPASTR